MQGRAPRPEQHVRLRSKRAKRTERPHRRDSNSNSSSNSRGHRGSRAGGGGGKQQRARPGGRSAGVREAAHGAGQGDLFLRDKYLPGTYGLVFSCAKCVYIYRSFFVRESVFAAIDRAFRLARRVSLFFFCSWGERICMRDSVCLPSGPVVRSLSLRELGPRSFSVIFVARPWCQWNRSQSALVTSPPGVRPRPKEAPIWTPLYGVC